LLACCPTCLDNFLCHLDSSRELTACIWCLEHIVSGASYLESWLKIYISYLVYSYIWLNLCRPAVFLHLPMDGRHFGYKIKFLQKTTANAIFALGCYVFPEFLTWLITYFQCTCSYPMVTDCPRTKKQGRMSVAFH
jgi:hypothetical protein